MDVGVVDHQDQDQDQDRVVQHQVQVVARRVVVERTNLEIAFVASSRHALSIEIRHKTMKIIMNHVTDSKYQLYV